MQWFKRATPLFIYLANEGVVKIFFQGKEQSRFNPWTHLQTVNPRDSFIRVAESKDWEKDHCISVFEGALQHRQQNSSGIVKEKVKNRYK